MLPTLLSSCGVEYRAGPNAAAGGLPTVAAIQNPRAPVKANRPKNTMLPYCHTVR
jgi:hypothetical protein